MSLEENKALVRRFYESAATGTLDDELIAEDFLYHGPPMLGEVRGRDGFKQIMSVFRGAFPNFETTVEDVIAEEDRVAVRHTHHVTQSGEFAGIPATGKEATVSGIELLRVRDGQIVEFWHMDDFLALLQQLGAIPAAAQPGA
jgi:steroid delta-isomerase-like uncharacterized protein